jgi:predicted  nucleic acid-binding Zn-ribbon protein
MAIHVTKTLQKALVELQAEQKQISKQIAAIEKVLGGVRSRRRSAARSQAASRGKRARKAMSAAARKAVSRRMKAYWAKRRAASAKGKARGTQKAE